MTSNPLPNDEQMNNNNQLKTLKWFSFFQRDDFQVLCHFFWGIPYMDPYGIFSPSMILWKRGCQTSRRFFSFFVLVWLKLLTFRFLQGHCNISFVSMQKTFDGRSPPKSSSHQ